MSTNKLADLLFEAEFPEIALAHYLVACSPNKSPTGCNHLWHFSALGNESSDIMKECCKNGILICSRFVCKVGCLLANALVERLAHQGNRASLVL